MERNNPMKKMFLTLRRSLWVFDLWAGLAAVITGITFFLAGVNIGLVLRMGSIGIIAFVSSVELRKNEKTRREKESIAKAFDFKTPKEE